ncbi:putative nuclease HARBI1 [Portunus trituberculatus]|uniref:putative nuclease HARBI1 n=1 Tax=Portunus trituberculatus TaxID=210409 RepID=UPI001E1D20F1|nr:putative nuclease HARBI1 [Portunus trituberculatus]XP_045107414.1 putative nuclease HARBI1 [Portunus trituberculatus]
MAHQGVFYDDYYAGLAFLEDEANGGDAALDAAAILLARRGVLVRDLIEREQHDRHPTRVEAYVEEIVPMYNDNEFKSHFRMKRETFERLQELLAPHLPSRQVTPEKKLLASLWLLGNKESFRGVADRFNFNKGFLHGIFFEVCSALEAVQVQFLSWPTRPEQNDIAERFLQKTGFPGIVGCIDGSHIPIPGPSHNRAGYINRKGFPSIQLQAVCDDNLLFLDIITGWPGSVNDARVFRNSPLYDILERGSIDENHHLLGDSAYGLAMYMMVPFRHYGHLSAEQTNYNVRHSSARVAIERAFGLLKSKFRRLQYLEMRLIEKIPSVILSACILHNFILKTEKIDINEVLEDVANLHEGNVHEYDGDLHQDNRLAINKRNELANLLV